MNNLNQFAFLRDKTVSMTFGSVWLRHYHWHTGVSFFISNSLSFVQTNVVPVLVKFTYHCDEVPQKPPGAPRNYFPPTLYLEHLDPKINPAHKRASRTIGFSINPRTCRFESAVIETDGFIDFTQKTKPGAIIYHFSTPPTLTKDNAQGKNTTHRFFQLSLIA